jgi:hypothetical protein
MDTKKPFFRTSSPGQIKSLPNLYTHPVNFDNPQSIEKLLEALLVPRIKEGHIMKGSLVPPKLVKRRDFMKYGDKLFLPSFSLEDMIAGKLTPVRLREQHYSNFFNTGVYVPMSGFVFEGNLPEDKRPRDIRLVEAARAARLYWYAHHAFPEQSPDVSLIEIKSYDTTLKVNTMGAKMTVIVPSRTRGKPRYKFEVESVAVTNNDNKYGISWNISTEGHDCESKVHEIRYGIGPRREVVKVVGLCAHEMAAIIEHADVSITKFNNTVPLETLQIPLISEMGCLLTNTLEFNCLVQTEFDKHPRILRDREKEAIMGLAVQRFGYRAILYAAHTKLRDYKWRTMAQMGWK